MDELIFAPDLKVNMLSYTCLRTSIWPHLGGTWELHMTFLSHSATAFLFKKPLRPLLVWKLRRVCCIGYLSLEIKVLTDAVILWTPPLPEETGLRSYPRSSNLLQFPVGHMATRYILEKRRRGHARAHTHKYRTRIWCTDGHTHSSQKEFHCLLMN